MTDMNPYEAPSTPPVAAQPPVKCSGNRGASRTIPEFISLSGSFSRAELLVATLVLGFLAIAISLIQVSFPALLSQTAAALLTYGLYPIWGFCLGKRSRDLGTTFTYGMIVGMLFPVLGLIFLFQPGRKAGLKGKRENDRSVTANRP